MYLIKVPKLKRHDMATPSITELRHTHLMNKLEKQIRIFFSSKQQANLAMSALQPCQPFQPCTTNTTVAHVLHTYGLQPYLLVYLFGCYSSVV